jgi:hypothetical protein
MKTGITTSGTARDVPVLPSTGVAYQQLVASAGSAASSYTVNAAARREK